VTKAEKEFVEDFYGVYNDCEYTPKPRKSKKKEKGDE